MLGTPKLHYINRLRINCWKWNVIIYIHNCFRLNYVIIFCQMVSNENWNKCIPNPLQFAVWSRSYDPLREILGKKQWPFAAAGLQGKVRQYPEGLRHTNLWAPLFCPLRHAIFPRDKGKMAILKRILWKWPFSLYRVGKTACRRGQKSLRLTKLVCLRPSGYCAKRREGLAGLGYGLDSHFFASWVEQMNE